MTPKNMVKAAGRAADDATAEFGRAWPRLSKDAQRGAVAVHVIAAFESYGLASKAADVIVVMRSAWDIAGCGPDSPRETT